MKIFKGEEKLRSVSAWSPKIDLSEDVEKHGEGDYKIVLNLGGPGGVSAATLNITATAEATAKGSCATVSTHSYHPHPHDLNTHVNISIASAASQVVTICEVATRLL